MSCVNPETTTSLELSNTVSGQSHDANEYNVRTTQELDCVHQLTHSFIHDTHFPPGSVTFSCAPVVCISSAVLSCTVPVLRVAYLWVLSHDAAVYNIQLAQTRPLNHGPAH